MGRFGLALAILGLFDISLSWFPAAFGNWQWEFGTIASTVAALPLTSIGFGCVLASALARGSRRVLRTVAIVLGLIGLAVLCTLVLFYLDVPLALRASGETPAALGVKKAIVKTSALGLGFAAVYLTGSALAWRHGRWAT